MNLNRIWTVEPHRFFDHWLKKIENGVMKEQPILYYNVDAPQGSEWKAASKWPPAAQQVKFYLEDGTSGSAHSLQEGLLSPDRANAEGLKDSFTVDYSIACKQTQPFLFWPCSVDEEALTYTTGPLESDMQVACHPVAHLWVGSTALDGDFFVNVEDVAPDGSVQLTNTGRLKALHRAAHEPPYNFLGLPWHRSYQKDATDLPRGGDPVELEFALWPISKVFKAGHRLRVTIAGSDPRQRYREQFNRSPVVTVYRDREHASYITVPAVRAETRTGGDE